MSSPPRKPQSQPDEGTGVAAVEDVFNTVPAVGQGSHSAGFFLAPPPVAGFGGRDDSPLSTLPPSSPPLCPLDPHEDASADMTPAARYARETLAVPTTNPKIQSSPILSPTLPVRPKRRRHSLSSVNSYTITTYDDGQIELIELGPTHSLNIRTRGLIPLTTDNWIAPEYPADETQIFSPTTVFGMPTNLKLGKPLWSKLLDTVDIVKLRISMLSESGRGKHSKLHGNAEAFDERRRLVIKTLVQVARLLRTVKGPGDTPQMKEGAIGWNWVLARAAFGKKRADSLRSILSQMDRPGQDDWIRDHLSYAALTSAATRYGPLPVSGATSNVYDKLDLVTILKAPHAGPKLQEIIDTVAACIRAAKEPETEVIASRIELSAWPIYVALAEPMFQDSFWDAAAVKAAREGNKDAMAHTHVLYRQRAKEKLMPAIKARAMALADSDTVLPHVPIRDSRVRVERHPLMPVKAKFDRHTTKTDTDVEDFLIYFRSLKINLGRLSDLEGVHLPTLDTLSTHELGLDGFDGVTDMVSSMRQQVAEPYKYIHTVITNELGPLIRQLRSHVPQLESRLRNCPVEVDAEAVKTAASDSPTFVEGQLTSNYCIIYPDPAMTPVAQIVTEITSERRNLEERQDTIKNLTDEAAFEAARARHCNRVFPLTTILPKVIAIAKTELSNESRPADCAHLAIKAIEYSHYNPQTIQGKMSGFSFGNVGTLISRVKDRAGAHFEGEVLDRALTAIRLLLFDTLILTMIFQTPGFSYLWIETEVRRIFIEVAGLLPKSATVFSRLEADLVGIDINMTVKTTSGCRAPRNVAKAWEHLKGDRLSIHPSWFRRMLDIQQFMCNLPFCRHLLTYDVEQRFTKGADRAALVSVQQLLTRGTIELRDGCPPFPSFTCLVVLFVYRYSRALATYASLFICLIHATERKTLGKHDVALLQTLSIDAASRRELMSEEVLEGDDLIFDDSAMGTPVGKEEWKPETATDMVTPKRARK